MSRKNEERWLERLHVFKKYLAEEGRFPTAGLVYEGFNLGVWFVNQQRAYKAGTLSANRKAMMDAVHPAWCKGDAARKEANRDLLLASKWKRHLQSGDVAIDQVFSGDVLHQSLRQGIFSCRDYLNAFDKKFTLSHFEQISVGMQACFPENCSFFDLSQRKAVFEAQFPNLDFYCFNIYRMAFHFHGLYEEEELMVMDRPPTLFEVATVLSARSQFKTRSEMRATYDAVLKTLTPLDQSLLYEKFFNGKSDVEIAKKVGFKEHKKLSQTESFVVGQIYGALIRLKMPMRSKYLIPKVGQDCSVDQAFNVNLLENAENVSLKELRLPDVTCERLYYNNIKNLAQLAALSKTELKRFRYLSKFDIDNIVFRLADFGLEFAPESSMDVSAAAN